MKKADITPIGLVIGIIAFIISGAWVVFIPIAFLIITYYLVKEHVKNKCIAVVVSYYINSIIMSFIGILIFYYPDTIGGGLFESGYILADFMTLNSIVDWIIKIQTDSWGIVYNWIIVCSAALIPILLLLLSKLRKKAKHS